MSHTRANSPGIPRHDDSVDDEVTVHGMRRVQAGGAHLLDLDHRRNAGQRPKRVAEHDCIGGGETAVGVEIVVAGHGDCMARGCGDSVEHALVGVCAMREEEDLGRLAGFVVQDLVTGFELLHWHVASWGVHTCGGGEAYTVVVVIIWGGSGVSVRGHGRVGGHIAWTWDDRSGRISGVGRGGVTRGGGRVRGGSVRRGGKGRGRTRLGEHYGAFEIERQEDGVDGVDPAVLSEDIPLKGVGIIPRRVGVSDAVPLNNGEVLPLRGDDSSKVLKLRKGVVALQDMVKQDTADIREAGAASKIGDAVNNLRDDVLDVLGVLLARDPPREVAEGRVGRGEEREAGARLVEGGRDVRQGVHDGREDAELVVRREEAVDGGARDRGGDRVHAVRGGRVQRAPVRLRRRLLREAQAQQQREGDGAEGVHGGGGGCVGEGGA